MRDVERPVFREPLFWIEWAFRLVGVAFMVVGLLLEPFDSFLFIVGLLNYVFSLFIMKKRREAISKGPP